MTLPIQIFTDNTFKTVQKNVVETNITLASPFKTGFIAADPDVTVDIEPNITLSIDDGCVLIITEN